MTESMNQRVKTLLRIIHPRWHRTWPYKSFLVNQPLQFIYCPIPKVACTSLKNWFASLLLKPEVLNNCPDIHSATKKEFSLAQFSSSSAREILQSYYTFAFVREPLERIESAFNNKFVRKRKNTVNQITVPVIEWVHVHLRNKKLSKSDKLVYETDSGGRYELAIDPDLDYWESISFQEFVSYLCATKDKDLNQHWRPQSNFLPEHIKMNIFQLENLDQAKKALAEQLSIQAVEIPTLNVCKKKVYEANQLQDYSCIPAGNLRKLPSHSGTVYTSRLRDRIGERYAHDLELYSKAQIRQRT